MLDTRLLLLFLKVIETGSFGKAADSLGIAQSVASKRLARLEDKLGVRLLERGSRSQIRLTRAGELFVDEARRALAAVETAERVGRNIGRGEAGPLRVGYVFSAAMSGVLTKLVAGLRAALPMLDVQPRLLDTPTQLAEIERGAIDVAIVRPRPAWPLAARPVGAHKEALIIAMASSSPLAAAHEIRPRDLVGQVFITPQFHEKVGLADEVHQLARAGGLADPDIRRTDDFITAAALAAAGCGVILAPASLANLALEGLTFRPIADYRETLSLFILARTDAPPLPLAHLDRLFG